MKRPRFPTWLCLCVAFFFAEGCAFADNAIAPLDYDIQAIRYATVVGFPKEGFVPSAADDEKIDIAMMFWLVRGQGKTILVDTGFYRERWFEFPGLTEYLRPDKALALTGVSAGDVTDVIITHMHWDHAGGVDLFPNATVWIQEDEFTYYTGAAWQRKDAAELGIDADDALSLVRRNTVGKLALIQGDDVEVAPGIRVFIGARHTYASQYVLVEGRENIVLASDNCGLFENIERLQAIGMLFSDDDVAKNVAALSRMQSLAGRASRVIPGHDLDVFKRFNSDGRVATIR